MEHFQAFARHLTTGAPLGPNGVASVRVKLAGTDTDATLYADNAGTPTPKVNPFSASAAGLVSFYAANGRYDVTVTPSAFDQAMSPAAVAYTLADVLLDDPED